ncbi:hypothetical protein [Amycolatopsis sulphurea]|uniref:hypothetical protein n=1 Tax=Amycolatopsis sulphurea TaxID=76022 RepID=UPI001FE9327D|nr:hypothetical protein [Amycolatopsis sulphurea]
MGLPQPSRKTRSRVELDGAEPRQVSGALPVPEEHRAFAPPGRGLPQPTGQAPRSRREQVETTTVDRAPAAPEEAPKSPETNAEPPKRQRVSLCTAGAASEMRQEPEEDSEIQVYAAPVFDGLGNFDLGSVPASVTPPKTWRKAAWFATGASGAVVVGLLFAGTFLVGGPATTTDALGGGWPGRQNGGRPDLSALLPSDGPHGGSAADTPERHTGETTPDEAPADQASGTTPGTRGTGITTGAGATTDTGSSSAGTPTGGSASPTPSTTPSSSEPQKPPVTPAERETTPSIYYASHNTKKMGDNSEKFFNNVTTNPSEASSVTSGNLQQQGSQGLRKRYADVAYFEVKKVTIDPDHNTTVNTVEVTHDDGRKSTEQQTLTFDDTGKITDDGK